MNDDMLQLIEDEKRSMMHMESFYDNRFHQHNLQHIDAEIEFHQQRINLRKQINDCIDGFPTQETKLTSKQGEKQCETF